MKKLALSVIALAGLALLASCKKDNDSTNGTFKASIEQQIQNGKTAIDTTGTQGAITWSEGDEILISNGSDSETFTLQAGEGTINGTFSTTGALAMTGNYTAAYPATANISGTTVTFSLPATQTMANGESGTFANGANPMVAVANGTTNLAFKNPCGGLGIRLKGATEGITVTNIRIIGSNTDVLWGNLTVTMNADGDVASTSIANTATAKNIIDLACNVTLSTTEAKRFFIMLPEDALQHGFTLEVSYGAAEPYSKSTGDTDIAQVQRNTMKSLNAITIGTVAPVVTMPAVTTTVPTEITLNSAKSGGENIDNGGGTITEYGICWSETANPTTSDTKLYTVGEPLTDYTFTMTGLDENTTYHVRAYVTNEAGTAYGEDKEFSTAAYVAPTVTTGTVAATTATTATGHVTLTNAGSGTVTELGLCWGTSDNPTVSNNHAVAAGQEVGTEYAINITGLTAGAQYYVRGYAKVGEEYYYATSSVSFMVTWDGNLSALTGSEPAGFATATDGMTIYGTLNANVKISIVDDGATVTLNNATITGTNSEDYLWAGINCENNATIILEGTNNVTSFWEDYPGIYIAPGKTLTIQGSGTLNASSNGGADGWGAGIGGSDLVDCGNIVINSGTINATGGIWMAGIGGGFKKNCGSITINGGNVTATGGRGAAGIGTGASQVNITCGDISITGGIVNATGGRGAAGIGSGFVTYNGIHNTCGNISITGGQVTATGGDGGDHVYPEIFTNNTWANYTYYGGAGIGTGTTPNDGSSEGSSSCGTITIGSGVTSVTATKGGGTRPATNSIGKNHSSNQGTCGTITIGGTEYPSGANPNVDDVTFVYPFQDPELTTGNVTDYQTAGTGHVTLTNAGTGPVTELGLCWGTSSTPTVSNSHAAAAGQTVGTVYDVNINGLTSGTLYYIRGYAKVGSNYYYASNTRTLMLVSSLSDWNSLASVVNNGTAATVQVFQTANISGVTTVVGTESHPFNGTYNGQGYAISNVSIHGSTHVGLFGYVNDASAVIENVVVASGSVSGTSQNVGAIVGTVYKGTVRYCANYAQVSSSLNTSANTRVGGIVGWMRSNGGTDNHVEYCINYGAVHAKYYVGGVVGSHGTGYLTYCQNYGTITGNFNTSAGIAGWSTDYEYVTNNHNGGNIIAGSTSNKVERFVIGNKNGNEGFPSNNTYLSSLTVTSAGTVYTGSSLSSFTWATALTSNPAGITIGGTTYGPTTPAP